MVIKPMVGNLGIHLLGNNTSLYRWESHMPLTKIGSAGKAVLSLLGVVGAAAVTSAGISYIEGKQGVAGPQAVPLSPQGSTGPAGSQLT